MTTMSLNVALYDFLARAKTGLHIAPVPEAFDPD